MDTSINSRPLLQPGHSDSEEFIEEDYEHPSPDHGYHDGAGGTTTTPTYTTTDDEGEHLVKNPTIAPSDRFSFNYIVFYLMGIITLLPWNFFMTAEDYWMYKFRNVTNNSSMDITPIQATFTSDLSFSAAVPNTLFLIVNCIWGHKLSLKIRMIGSMVIVLIFFMLSTALVKVNTDSWQDEFFDVTIGSVVIMNIATAFLCGGLFGIAGQFPSEYMTAVVSGQALGGIFSALTEIVTITFATEATVSAFTFFMIGNAVLIICLLAYIVTSKTKYFKYYTVDKLAIAKANQEQRATVSRAPTEPSFRNVLNKIWLYGFTEWLVFAVTLSVYPSVTVLVNSELHGNGHPWNDVYFIPVTNYLIFNSGDYLGRILAGMIEWPHNKPSLLAFFSILRIAFIPALLLCNTNPRHHIPVFIHSDYVFIILMVFFAFSNGYLANMALICAPKTVHSREKEMASSSMAAFLGLGTAFGSTLSLIIVQFL